MFLSNRKMLSYDNNEDSIEMVSFSDCVNLVELSKIHAASMHILYNIGRMEGYCNIVSSQQG
jgi:hypothetical protein